jgi:hypothetical protein
MDDKRILVVEMEKLSVDGPFIHPHRPNHPGCVTPATTMGSLSAR